MLPSESPTTNPPCRSSWPMFLSSRTGTRRCGATDLNHGGRALLIDLLAGLGENIRYIPGRTCSTPPKFIAAKAKPTQKDAAVIASQARMRIDLQPLHDGAAPHSRGRRTLFFGNPAGT